MNLGRFSFILFLGFCIFAVFGLYLAIFAFYGFGFEGVWGCFGQSRGVKGGLLDPYRKLVAPPEVLYCTRFGSKHHIMVQLAYVNRVGITDPLSDLWSPPWGPQRASI